MNAKRTDNTPGDGGSTGLIDGLETLLVFDILEVGPVRLENCRLAAPYRLKADGRIHETELIYSYEETVFDQAEPESRNLASMIAAQVAINYGLFCREIIFHGLFDPIDQRFIREMAENTAREIYVKKFLEPNPFLVDAAGRLQPEKRKRYLHAQLSFPEGTSKNKSQKWRMWHSRKDRYGILSSGGKDSLLSFGLMQEIVAQDGNGANGAVHPIFINEAGRHWFTALNAYRHFQSAVPNTARVWVNSDRLFAWMLRHMPFIRKDFTNIRTDEYPIRLWTVAVFLFGALPLIRKRGIGRLIIGDEFDTSRRVSTHGIRHYDGLYDQSVWFDETLSRYFEHKGWSVNQFSILRPLSELLIEKILARRYPHLLEHQTSCHATHKTEDRMRPCGKCEKCRRIVGILTALGENPAVCGYREDQVAACLEALFTKGVYSQASAEAGQLFFMLARLDQDRIPEKVSHVARPHPEIMQLRFDPKISPIDGIPEDLRVDLYRIYMQYAEGAVEHLSKRWKAVALLTHPLLKAPYAFESDKIKIDEQVATETAACTSNWGELCWPDAAQRLKIVDTALLPVGAIEQHGPHLPLDTDAFDAAYLAKCIAAGCSDPKPLVLPLIAYGVSYHHEAFKGTISINNDTLANLVYDVGISLASNGIKKLVIVNGHGGNAPSLNFAAQRINQDARIFVCVDTGETSDVDVEGLIETPNDVHAGEIETSTSLAIRPHLVRMDRLQMEVPEFTSRYLDFTSKRGVSWYAHTHKISNSGVMGDPTCASVEKGEKMWALIIKHLVNFVEQLKTMTLKEIYQRKY